MALKAMQGMAMEETVALFGRNSDGVESMLVLVISQLS